MSLRRWGLRVSEIDASPLASRNDTGGSLCAGLLSRGRLSHISLCGLRRLGRWVGEIAASPLASRNDTTAVGYIGLRGLGLCAGLLSRGRLSYITLCGFGGGGFGLAYSAEGG